MLSVYVLKNKVSGKVHQPFFMESNEDAKDFCLMQVLSDKSGAMERVAPMLDLYYLGTLDINCIDMNYNEPDISCFPRLSCECSTTYLGSVLDILKEAESHLKEVEDVKD